MIAEEILVKSEPEKIQEPWSVALLHENIIAVYDYKAGSIWRVSKINDQWIISGMIGAVQLGQWVSMKADGHAIYVSCSEENVVRRFQA